LGLGLTVSEQFRTSLHGPAWFSTGAPTPLAGLVPSGARLTTGAYCAT
jgi:hypothetical protein